MADGPEKIDTSLLDGSDPILGANLSDNELAWVNQLDLTYGFQDQQDWQDTQRDWNEIMNEQ